MIKKIKINESNSREIRENFEDYIGQVFCTRFEDFLIDFISDIQNKANTIKGYNPDWSVDEFNTDEIIEDAAEIVIPAIADNLFFFAGEVNE